MGFRGGGGQIDPPPHILVFKYPSRDRVKKNSMNALLDVLLELYADVLNI